MILTYMYSSACHSICINLPNYILNDWRRGYDVISIFQDSGHIQSEIYLRVQVSWRHSFKKKKMMMMMIII